MKMGLEKMVEFLEKSIEIFGDNLPTRAALFKARELLEEGKSQKPTAPASLVEELRKWYADKLNTGLTASAIEIQEILSRYEGEDNKGGK